MPKSSDTKSPVYTMPSRQIIVFGERGEIIHSPKSGPAASLATIFTDKSWQREMQQRRLAAVRYNDRPYSIMRIELEIGFALLIDDGSSEELLRFISSVDFSWDIFSTLIGNPYDAMTVVDSAGVLRYISSVHEKFFGISPGEAIGKSVQDVIENTRLHIVAETGKPEIGRAQTMQNTSRIVARMPIERDGKVIGAIGRVMFKGPDAVESLHKRLGTLSKEVDFYRNVAESRRKSSTDLNDIIGESLSINKLRADIAKFAPTDFPVLITGESGVGKELVAKALHSHGRGSANLVTVNAAALPASLVESELFGFEHGSFTGARQKGHAGKFEQANGGSLFLDEVGDMPLDVQAKLLRVVQDGVVEKIGGSKPKKVNFRLITATNRDLRKMVDEREFRLDLFYRISQVILYVPPLRERATDIPLLARHFIKGFSEDHGLPHIDIDNDALDYLMTKPWPGNIRQLKHEIERAAIFAESSRISIDTVYHLESSILGTENVAAMPESPQSGADKAYSLQDAINQVENDFILESLRRNKGNKQRTAKELGISRSYLYRKLQDLDPVDETYSV